MDNPWSPWSKVELLTDATEKPYWNKEGKNEDLELLKNSRLLEKVWWTCKFEKPGAKKKLYSCTDLNRPTFLYGCLIQYSNQGHEQHPSLDEVSWQKFREIISRKISSCSISTVFWKILVKCMSRRFLREIKPDHFRGSKITFMSSTGRYSKFELLNLQKLISRKSLRFLHCVLETANLLIIW